MTCLCFSVVVLVLQEYLYGDEGDHYSGTQKTLHLSPSEISLSRQLFSDVGLAFSRDQPENIYIQHRIRESSRHIFDNLSTKKGHFYLVDRHGLFLK